MNGLRLVAALVLGGIAGLGVVNCGPSRATSEGAGGTGSSTGAEATSGASTSAPASGAGGDLDNPKPDLTAADLALLATLSPDTLPSPPPDISNAYADSAEAAAFGQKLFFSPVFAGRLLDGDNDGMNGSLGQKGETGKVACASCHVPTDDFSDTRSLGHQISLAAGWGRRRAPSLLDVGQAKLIMWDGRRDALYNQVFGPIESVVEMNSSRLYAARQVFVSFKPEYESVFGPLPSFDDTASFPTLSADITGCQPSTVDPQPTCNGTFHGSPGDGAEYDGMTPQNREAVTRVVVNVGKAIGAYERRLHCGQSRFDAWMHGQAEALTWSEQRGAQVFVGQGRCVGCHAGPFLSDQRFHDIGLSPTIVAAAFIDSDDHGAATGLAAALGDELDSRGPYSDGDDGRLPLAVPSSMEGSFRTPQLRCVGRRPSFTHTGQFQSLQDLIELKDAGGSSAGFLGTNELQPLHLSTRQKKDLVAFLKSLDGPGADPSLLSAP